jgi:hypothetical protein
MRIRTILAIGVLACTSAALAADSLSLRPGRWQFTVKLDLPQEMPAGMPFAEPMVQTSCVIPEANDLLTVSLPALAASDGCEVSDYTTTAREVSYEAVCEGVTMSMKWTLNSPDSISGHSVSHSKDPSEKLSMKFSGQRIGDQCTAQETAEAREELAELRAMLKK